MDLNYLSSSEDEFMVSDFSDSDVKLLIFYSSSDVSFRVYDFDFLDTETFNISYVSFWLLEIIYDISIIK